MHSPPGVKVLRSTLKDGLVRKYTGIAESMFKWTLPKEFEDFLLMTRDDEPEKTLLRNGQGAFFKVHDQVHFLPVVNDSSINMYGNPVSYRPVPIGWETTPTGVSAEVDAIREMILTPENSVLMRDNIFGRSDYAMICKMVDALVDTMLTVNQLTLLAKSPYVFRVNETNKLDAKNFFLALSQDYPAVFRYGDTDEAEPVTESTGVTIDTGLFDVYRQWENILLEQLGIPGSQPTQKRAQQSVAEVTLGDDMVSIRRKEKFRMRQNACDRMKELWGITVTVESLIDSHADEEELETGEETEDKGDDSNAVGSA